MREKAPRLPRFYFGGELRAGALVELPARAAAHARVLRLEAGESVVLFSGRGGEFAAQIASLGRSRATVEVGAWSEIEREPPVAVTLVQAVSTGEKMDFTIQKAVELGVAAIQPVLAARALVRLGAARAEAKLGRWLRIAIAACEQCGRNRVPAILPLLPLAGYCANPGAPALRLLLSPRARRSLRDAARSLSGPVAIAAGPEAGFGVEEEAMLAAAGFEPVRLGPRTLRTETAALAALAALNVLAGEG